MCAKFPNPGRALRAIPRGLIVLGFVILVGLFGNSGQLWAAAPIIEAFSPSSPTALPGEVILLDVQAYDPDCGQGSTCAPGGWGACGKIIDAPRTTWASDGGTYSNIDNGASGSPYAATAQWTAPDTEGIYTLTVSVTDLGGGSLCFNQRKTTSLDLGIQVSASSNQPPVINSLTASPVQIFPDESSSLTCTAEDPDGDPVGYSWETTSGTVTETGEGMAVFTGTSPGIATVTCTATDPQGAFGTDSIGISVTGAAAEKTIFAGLESPQRLSATSWGDLYVVDGSRGGLAVVNLMSGELVYRLPSAGLTSVAVDWEDNLLVGGRAGARVIDRLGEPILTLEGSAGEVADVAVDTANLRYGVLYRRSGRVKVFDETGSLVTAFGTPGDGPEQFMSPRGLAVTPVNSSWTSAHWIVGDTGHGLIKVFDGAGQFVSSFGGLGGGAGEFIQLGDVSVDDAGVIYASDTFQSWIQAFNPDGTPRETLGTYGFELGQLKTPSGVTKVAGLDRLVASSLNGSSLQVFVTSPDAASEGPAPAAAIGPASLWFGELPLGSTSAPQQVILSNSGDAPLGIRSIEVRGNFLQTNDCPPFLEPAQQCSLSISFNPQVAGPLSGVLRVDSSDAQANLQVALSGVGLTMPSLILTPALLTFAEQVVGTQSRPLLSKLTNPGAQPFALEGISTSGEYWASHDCPVVMAPGQYCMISVIFAPSTTTGQHLGTLTVMSDALGSPHAVMLEGTAVLPSFWADVADVTVDEGNDPENPNHAVFEVQVTPPSDGSVSVEFATVAGTATATEDFESTSGTLVFAAGESLKTVAVPIFGDLTLEPDEEDFQLELSAPQNAQINDGTGVATIVDDEVCPGPNLVRNAGLEASFDGQSLPDWVWIEASEYEQVIDVSAFEQAILEGRQLLYFSGWVLSEPGQPAPRLVVEYLDAATGAVLEAFDSGEIPPAPDWQHVIDSQLVHPDVGSVRIRVFSSWTTPAEVADQFDLFEFSSLRTPTLALADFGDYEGYERAETTHQVPATLACPYYLDVGANFQTSDGTATAGDDYEATSGSLTIPAGEVDSSVPVIVHGDAVDEDHETYYIELFDTYPTGAVLLQSPAIGLIINDDFDPENVRFWRLNPDLWSDALLQIGDVVYDQARLMAFLRYKGGDESMQLAKQLTATKLNLMVGSPPYVLPVVTRADDYLTLTPPGSRPTGSSRLEARWLRMQLQRYNNGVDY